MNPRTHTRTRMRAQERKEAGLVSGRGRPGRRVAAGHGPGPGRAGGGLRVIFDHYFTARLRESRRRFALFF